MTLGIYLIYLGETNKYYVGQGNIRERVQQHKSMLRNNRHYNYKLQQAYNTTKIFSYIVLMETLPQKYLYSMEEWYIEKFNSVNCGYNICAGGIAGRGIEHPSSVYSKEQIVSCLLMLVDPSTQFKTISELTGVSISTIRHISRREVHQWLDEEFPVETTILRQHCTSKIRYTRPSGGVRKYTSLISPEGTIYENIENICAFAKQHGLNNAHIGAVLRGSRKSHLGWTGYHESKLNKEV